MTDFWTNYEDARGCLSHAQDKRAGRPIANNTRLMDREDHIAVQLHATDIIRLYPNGDTAFDSGGWRTVTTLDRMSYNTAFSIFSAGGTWYIKHRTNAARIERRLRLKYGLPVEPEDVDDPYGFSRDGLPHLGIVRPRAGAFGWWSNVVDTIGLKDAHRIYTAFSGELHERTHHLFFDGIRFTKRGRCVNCKTSAQERKEARRQERERKQIKNFVKNTMRELSKEMPVHNPGDCFYCQMYTNDGRSLGEATDDPEHLRSHVEESYAPSALIVNAVLSESRTRERTALWLRMREENGELVMGGNLSTGRLVANSLYKYLMKRLVPGRAPGSPFARENWRN